MDLTLLEVRNVSKSFGSTKALRDVSLSIRKGTVHGLVGRNGAGKTTVVNVISGIIRQNEGQVYLNGTEISNLTVFERQQKGIRIVTQHASVIPHLTVAENVFMGLWPKGRFGLVDWSTMYYLAAQELQKYGMDVDPSQQVRNLGSVDQRKINIVRALRGGAELVILDEPTTSLSQEERHNLFAFVKQLSENGSSFILISHYLEEIINQSDDITVLRDGQAFTGYSKGTMNEKKLANLIAGEDVELYQRQNQPVLSQEKIVLECNGICGQNMKNISFSLNQGEVVGLVGFPGSGAREICRAIYGLHSISDGGMKINSTEYLVSNPAEALRQGVVYIPNDRHLEGIVPMLSIRENISLPILKKKLRTKLGLIDKEKEKTLAKHYFEQLKVKAESIESPMDSLSGGNQQKVVVSKAMAIEPSVMILDEPTVGIDVQSREEILTKVGEMTERGLGVLYLTNDYEELLRVADKLIFFSEGRIVQQIKNKGLSVEDVVKIRDAGKGGAA